MIVAWLFDLDGTLVDSERLNAEAAAVVLARRGRVMSSDERRFVVGHGWREIYEMLVANGGVDLAFDELKEQAGVAKEQLCLHQGLGVIPGAVEFVRALAAEAVGLTAVVSGSSRREIDFSLRTIGASERFSFYLGAEDVQQGKPSPEGYLAAAARLGVAPRDCVVFEDSTAGIAAARSAGMRCVALAAANFAGQDQSRAQLRVADYWTFLDGQAAPGGLQERVLGRLAGLGG